MAAMAARPGGVRRQKEGVGSRQWGVGDEADIRGCAARRRDRIASWRLGRSLALPYRMEPHVNAVAG